MTGASGSAGDCCFAIENVSNVQSKGHVGEVDSESSARRCKTTGKKNSGNGSPQFPVLVHYRKTPKNRIDLRRVQFGIKDFFTGEAQPAMS